MNAKLTRFHYLFSRGIHVFGGRSRFGITEAEFLAAGCVDRGSDPSRLQPMRVPLGGTKELYGLGQIASTWIPEAAGYLRSLTDGMPQRAGVVQVRAALALPLSDAVQSALWRSLPAFPWCDRVSPGALPAPGVKGIPNPGEVERITGAEKVATDKDNTLRGHRVDPELGGWADSRLGVPSDLLKQAPTDADALAVFPQYLFDPVGGGLIGADQYRGSGLDDFRKNTGGKWGGANWAQELIRERGLEKHYVSVVDSASGAAVLRWATMEDLIYLMADAGGDGFYHWAVARPGAWGASLRRGLFNHLLHYVYDIGWLTGVVGVCHPNMAAEEIGRLLSIAKADLAGTSMVAAGFPAGTNLDRKSLHAMLQHWGLSVEKEEPKATPPMEDFEEGLFWMPGLGSESRVIADTIGGHYEVDEDLNIWWYNTPTQRDIAGHTPPEGTTARQDAEDHYYKRGRYAYKRGEPETARFSARLVSVLGIPGDLMMPLRRFLQGKDEQATLDSMVVRQNQDELDGLVAYLKKEHLRQKHQVWLRFVDDEGNVRTWNAVTGWSTTPEEQGATYVESYPARQKPDFSQGAVGMTIRDVPSWLVKPLRGRIPNAIALTPDEIMGTMTAQELDGIVSYLQQANKDRAHQALVWFVDHSGLEWAWTAAGGWSSRPYVPAEVDGAPDPGTYHLQSEQGKWFTLRVVRPGDGWGLDWKLVNKGGPLLEFYWGKNSAGPQGAYTGEQYDLARLGDRKSGFRLQNEETTFGGIEFDMALRWARAYANEGAVEPVVPAAPVVPVAPVAQPAAPQVPQEPVMAAATPGAFPYLLIQSSDMTREEHQYDGGRATVLAFWKSPSTIAGGYALGFGPRSAKTPSALDFRPCRNAATGALCWFAGVSEVARRPGATWTIYAGTIFEYMEGSDLFVATPIVWVEAPDGLAAWRADLPDETDRSYGIDIEDRGVFNQGGQSFNLGWFATQIASIVVELDLPVEKPLPTRGFYPQFRYIIAALLDARGPTPGYLCVRIENGGYMDLHVASALDGTGYVVSHITDDQVCDTAMVFRTAGTAMVYQLGYKPLPKPDPAPEFLRTWGANLGDQGWLDAAKRPDFREISLVWAEGVRPPTGGGPGGGGGREDEDAEDGDQEDFYVPVVHDAIQAAMDAPQDVATFEAMLRDAGLNPSSAKGTSNGVFRAEIAPGCSVRFYDKTRAGGTGYSGWFVWANDEMITSGDKLADVLASARTVERVRSLEAVPWRAAVNRTLTKYDRGEAVSKGTFVTVLERIHADKSVQLPALKDVLLTAQQGNLDISGAIDVMRAAMKLDPLSSWPPPGHKAADEPVDSGLNTVMQGVGERADHLRSLGCYLRTRPASLSDDTRVPGWYCPDGALIPDGAASSPNETMLLRFVEGHKGRHGSFREWTLGELDNLPNGTVLEAGDGMVYVRDTLNAGGWFQGHPDKPFQSGKGEPVGRLQQLHASHLARVLVDLADPRDHGTWIMVPAARADFAESVGTYLQSPAGQARFAERVRKLGYQDTPDFTKMELSEGGGRIIVPRVSTRSFALPGRAKPPVQL